MKRQCFYKVVKKLFFDEFSRLKNAIHKNICLQIYFYFVLLLSFVFFLLYLFKKVKTSL